MSPEPYRYIDIDGDRMHIHGAGTSIYVEVMDRARSVTAAVSVPADERQAAAQAMAGDEFMVVPVERTTWACARCKGAPQTHAEGGANDRCLYEPILVISQAADETAQAARDQRDRLTADVAVPVPDAGDGGNLDEDESTYRQQGSAWDEEMRAVPDAGDDTLRLEIREILDGCTCTPPPLGEIPEIDCPMHGRADYQAAALMPAIRDHIAAGWERLCEDLEARAPSPGDAYHQGAFASGWRTGLLTAVEIIRNGGHR